MKVSKVSGVIAWSGGTTVLKKGRSIDPEHPLLAERPDLFEEGENKPDMQLPKTAEQVQQHPRPRVETTQAEGPAGGRVRKVQGQ